ncbi:LIC_13076 family protein [Leptospira wolffii]|uniref:LIC_13076 family protein n=1 Tax=Leptospira wolffii TaxID=409998 RepID=UPI0026B40014
MDLTSIHKKMIRISACTALLCLLNFCTIDKRISSNPEHRIILAAESSNSCKLQSSQSYWAFLGGLVPIRFLNSSFPEPPAGQTSRITETAQWHDYTVTILLGWLLAVTKRTFLVEFCEEGLYANHWNENKESIDQKLYRIAMTGKVTVQLVTGESFTSKLVGFDSENLFLEAKLLDEKAGLVDRAHLKDGSILEGKLVAQNEHEIEMETKANTLQFVVKSRLHRLELRVPVQKIEKKTVLKTDVAKLSFEGLE